jgi:hypothetical protein
MSLNPNPDYAKEAQAIEGRAREANIEHTLRLGASPKFLYLGIVERSTLTMAYGYPLVEVQGLRVIPVTLHSWLKVGI